MPYGSFWQNLINLCRIRPVRRVYEILMWNDVHHHLPHHRRLQSWAHPAQLIKVDAFPWSAFHDTRMGLQFCLPFKIPIQTHLETKLSFCKGFKNYSWDWNEAQWWHSGTFSIPISIHYFLFLCGWNLNTELGNHALGGINIHLSS
jgi:hypothetical protein